MTSLGTYNTREKNGTTASDLTAMAPPDEYGSNRVSQLLDRQQHLRTFDRLAPWGGRGGHTFTATGNGRPERIGGPQVTQQTLPLLGGEPAVGRLFAEGETHPAWL